MFMSRSTQCMLTCPCGEVFSSSIYEYVNVAKDPQLQYTVLAGLLNVSTCPSCNRRAAIARPLIYSDPARNLLAYVHPRADAPEEARSLILEKLRTVYMDIANNNPGRSRQSVNVEQDDEMPEIVERVCTTDQYSAHLERAPELPPLKVVFGLDQLSELINVSLNQDERLGKLALSTHSRNDAERGRMLDIARKLASTMECQIEVEDMPGEYTVWLYGSRRQIGVIMRELAIRG
jgi:CpXC protein